MRAASGSTRVVRRLKRSKRHWRTSCEQSCWADERERSMKVATTAGRRRQSALASQASGDSARCTNVDDMTGGYRVGPWCRSIRSLWAVNDRAPAGEARREFHSAVVIDADVRACDERLFHLTVVVVHTTCDAVRMVWGCANEAEKVLRRSETAAVPTTGISCRLWSTL
jgi:hypothetical protein